MPAGTRFCTACGSRMELAEPAADPATAAAQPVPGTNPEADAAPEPRPTTGAAPPPRSAESRFEPPPRPPSPSAAPRQAEPPQRPAGQVQYDPDVIQTFADALYRLADRIVIGSTLLGGVIGGLLGYAIGSNAGGGALVALLGAGVGGYLGYSRGMARTFQLRLEAQLALCQVEIEFNTRMRRA